ncbi:MAG TPA: hypothetical protein VGM31_07365 [Puia sp.]
MNKTAKPKQGFVLTPGGYRHHLRTYRIEKSNHIGIRGGRYVKIQSHSGEVVDDLGPVHDLGAVIGVAGEKTIEQGWVAYAGWLNDTGRPITSFSGKWVVPPPPAIDHGQTIFLFIGIQNTDSILQPVLQWGKSFAGGGPFWTITNWYVSGQGPAVCKDPVRVAPGDELEASISMVIKPGGVISYKASFKGHPDIDLEREGIQELSWANVVLESYKAELPTDYPPAVSTTMTLLEMTTGMDVVSPDWRLHPKQVAANDPHAVRIEDGEIDLFYGSGDVLG